MARFKIVGSRSTDIPNIADFDVIYLDGTLANGETFFAYDTHHPVKCDVIDVFVKESISTLQCKLHPGLAWENQFIDAIVDTQATTRPAAFQYDHSNDRL